MLPKNPDQSEKEWFWIHEIARYMAARKQIRYELARQQLYDALRRGLFTTQAQFVKGQLTNAEAVKPAGGKWIISRAAVIEFLEGKRHFRRIK